MQHVNNTVEMGGRGMSDWVGRLIHRGDVRYAGCVFVAEHSQRADCRTPRLELLTQFFGLG